MKKFLSLVLALVMTMSLVTISAGAKDFTDNSKITYKEAVDVVSTIGIVDGYTDGKFNPTNELTRGAAAKIICNLILGPTTASALSADTAPFKDVPTTNDFAGYIAYCSQQGIISGYADGTFRPGNPLTGYAFMKMLLGALGYDATIEGFVGANWSVQVGKLALGIGLDDGNDEFVGTKAVTREEACLYTFNTLQATMVEYDASTTVNVNGAEVTIGNSKAKEVSWGSATKNDGNIDGDGFVQFAEKYFDKLKLEDGGTDDFARPSNVWTYKADKIGTYAKTPDATYSKNVKLGDIYADLGMSKKDTAEVFINGEEGGAVVVSKANDVKVASSSANKGAVDVGTTVEVFRDDDTNDVTICVIDNYVGSISKTVEAKGNKDAYIVVANESGNAISGFDNEYETEEEFEDDAIVLFTYSQSADAIKSVVVAESASGTLTKKADKKVTDTEVEGKKLTIDGTEYSVAKNVGFDTTTFDAMTVKSDYVVYLDQYGNIIYVGDEEFVAADYAMILAIESEKKDNFNSNRVKLLTAEGVVKTYDTDKDYTTSNNGSMAKGDIVTFKLNDDDKEATLRLASKSGTVVGGSYMTANDGKFKLENGKASITYGSKEDEVYSNSKTVFVVYDGDDYKAYTGIKNVPSIKADSTKNATVGFNGYCKTSDMLTVAFIDASASGVIFDNDDVLFLAGASKSNRITDNDGVYYEYNAVINGKITETVVKVDENVDLDAKGVHDKYSDTNYLFNGYNDNKYDIVTSVNNFSGDVKAYAAVGTIKLSGDYTIGFGTDKDHPDKRFTVAEDANIFRVDEDGVITEVKLNNIKTDANDTALYVVDDGQITNLFVQEVDDDTIVTPPTNASGNIKNSTSTISRNGLLTLNVQYERPDHVTSNTDVELDIEVFADGGYAETVQVTIPAGRTSARVTANGFYDANEAISLKLVKEAPDAVVVSYSPKSAVTSAAPKSVVVDAASTLEFTLNTTATTGTIKYTVKQGNTVLASDESYDLSGGKTITTAALADIDGSAAVVVTIEGMSDLTENFKVTLPTVSGYTFSTIPAAAATTGVDAGTDVVIKVTANADPTETNAKFGKEVAVKGFDAVLLKDTNATTIGSVTMNGPVEIKAADVTVTDVAKLAQDGDATLEGDTLTVTFNRDIASGASFTTNAADAEIINVSVSGKTAVITLTGTLAGGEKVSINSVKDAVYADNTATGDVYTQA